MPIPTPRVERELLSSKIAAILRDRIISAELPDGTRLVEDELAGQLGTSRAPLRAALEQLHREGLVQVQPGRGSFVKGLSVQGILDLYAVRSVLEVFAAERAAVRMQPEDIEHLRDLVARMHDAVVKGSREGFVHGDINVHRAIWRASGNERLVEMLENLVLPLTVLFRINAEKHDDWPWVVDRHRRLVEALSTRDGQVAANHMRDSHTVAVHRVLEALNLAASQGQEQAAVSATVREAGGDLPNNVRR
jgi:DNA-binding GntR family transcriptional regulator